MKKSIQQLFEEYLFECEYVQKLKPRTLHVRKQSFATLKKIIPDLSLESLTYYNIVNFFQVIEERNRIVGKGKIISGVKKSTVAKYWSAFNGFFLWLKSNDHISENPLSKVKRPSPRYENRQFLKKAEIEKILTAILYHSENVFLMKRNLVIVNIFLLCGLRRQELQLLQIKDIDFEKNLLTIRAETSKVERTRQIPIHVQLIQYLKDYLKERKQYTTPYLIVSFTRDAGLSSHGLHHLVARICQLSGVKFHVHQFRHTFAVNFLKSSNSIAKLQQLLGHTDASMTLQYLRCLEPQEMKQDIDAMAIDQFI